MLQIEDSCLKINKMRSLSSFICVFSLFCEIREEWDTEIQMMRKIFRADDFDVTLIFSVYLLCSKMYMEWDMSCFVVIFTYIAINTLLKSFFCTLCWCNVSWYSIYCAGIGWQANNVFSKVTSSCRGCWPRKKTMY